MVNQDSGILDCPQLTDVHFITITVKRFLAIELGPGACVDTTVGRYCNYF